MLVIKTMKNRINYIDIAKGFLILYLIVFHFRWGTMKAGINCNEFLYLLDYTKIISCFFMPAFFILSGYCSSFNTNFVNFAKKHFAYFSSDGFLFICILCIRKSVLW